VQILSADRPEGKNDYTPRTQPRCDMMSQAGEPGRARVPSSGMLRAKGRRRSVALPLGLLAALALSGCQPTWKPVDDRAVARSKAKTLLLVILQPSAFLGPTNWTTSGLIPVVIRGELILEKYHLVDPAPAIGHKIAESLSRAYALELQSFVETSAPTSTNQFLHRRLPTIRTPFCA
jgi:hypothetical protein